MSTTYSSIKKHCEDTSTLSKAVIDDFLIHYAAGREKLVPQMEAQLKKYKKTAQELPVQYVNFLKSEYIAHKIFKKGGNITKYLNHSEIRKLPEPQYRFLEFQAVN